MKCFHPECHRTFPEYSLFRINAKGQPAVWACQDHIKHSDKKVDKELINFVVTIERGNAK